MGFSNSFGEYLFTLFIVFWLFVLLAAKLFRTIDDDGTVRKTANDGFADWIRRRFK